MFLTILHIEDDRIVADAVKDMLEECGWRIVTCADGAAALDKLAAPIAYDLLITDAHLPRVNGLEIVRYARTLPHRRNILIIMFTATECGQDASEAGINAYLRKSGGHIQAGRDRFRSPESERVRWGASPRWHVSGVAETVPRGRRAKRARGGL
jgi:CheY-like chemotaxis protein